MATNPLVDQGTLNRLRSSVIWKDFPQLNVTAPFLGEGGIALALEGDTTVFINTMTGAVTSLEPFQIAAVTINLLKTQSLADLYKQQMETSSLLGTGIVRTDAKPLSPYQLFNCSIQSLAPLQLNGKDAGFALTIKGYYNINSSLWSL